MGSAILQSRQAKGWSQAQLAQATRLSASAIAMYETNRRHPNMAALTKLEQVLGPLNRVQDKSRGAIGRDTVSPCQIQSNEVFVSESSQKEAQASSIQAEEAQASATNEAPEARTTLVVTRTEARLLLFLRMHPECQPFFDSYISANQEQRDRLERTWHLLHSFQTPE